MLQPLSILRIPKLAAISLKESLTKHQPISIQTAQYLSHLWMHYRWLPQTRTPLSKINKAILQLVSTIFETKSFKLWNKVFQAGKQSVSHRETDCFKPWNNSWNQSLLVKRWWSCCPSPVNSLFIEETEKRWKGSWKGGK